MPAKKKAAKKATKKRVRKTPQVNSYQRDDIVKRVVPDFRGNDAYKADLAEEIEARLSMGETLTSICNDEHMPSRMSVWRWERDNPDFELRLTKARLKQADSGFDEIMDIPDALAVEGRIVTNEQIALAKLRADSRKFRVARLNRALYGDKADIGLGGVVDAPPVEVEVNHTSLTPKEQEQLRSLARKAITGREGK